VLALEYYKCRRAWPSEDSSRDLGSYSSILRNWDGEKFSDSLAEVCDYHCRNMEDIGGDWNAEFKYSPFDVMPIEILAIVKVRASFGLGQPEINHPLLSTPLGKLEHVPVPSEDDTRRQV